MTLEKYLKLKNISAISFGISIGLKNPKNIYRYLRGERIPHRSVMEKIMAATKGKVKADSFYGGQ